MAPPKARSATKHIFDKNSVKFDEFFTRAQQTLNNYWLYIFQSLCTVFVIKWIVHCFQYTQCRVYRMLPPHDKPLSGLSISRSSIRQIILSHYITVQGSTVQCTSVKFNTKVYSSNLSTVQCSSVQCITVQCSALQYSA